jgi:hypothetical protein
VPRQESVDDVGYDGVFVSHNTGEQRDARFQSLKQITPDFFPDTASPKRSLRPAAVLQFTQGTWLDHDGVRSIKDQGRKARYVRCITDVFEGSERGSAHLDNVGRGRTFASRPCWRQVTAPRPGSSTADPC